MLIRMHVKLRDNVWTPARLRAVTHATHLTPVDDAPRDILGGKSLDASGGYHTGPREFLDTLEEIKWCPVCHPGMFVVTHIQCDVSVVLHAHLGCCTTREAYESVAHLCGLIPSSWRASEP